MWPNPAPPPPMGQQNPAFPPGYSAPYLPAPGPGVYPQAPPPAYPGYPTAQYPPSHYSAPVSPAMIHYGPPGPMPHGPPGVMPYGPPGPHAYPMHPAGHACHPKGVHLGHLLHYPKGFGHGPHKGHHHHHHHDGFNPTAGILAGGMAVGMGLLSHKANKKMRKKMKKAHKYHMHGHYKHGKWSSSSSSDSD
ncbi:proline-rich protein 13-like [Poecilia latipinna]|uniref:proline-rich protein 13-like n=1 Tax=Poecilia latipinna TaxID=48699 RepID=UPI00072E9742|nr:PREDICTED: proline-rich protein 13-like [Poecilia latipinna]